MNKKQIISGAISFLALISVLNGCAKKNEKIEEIPVVTEEEIKEFDRDVYVFEFKKDENVDDLSWYTVTEDRRQLVNLEKLIKNKLSISDVAIYNENIKELKSDIENYLGENIYLDYNSYDFKTLTNEERSLGIMMQFSDFKDYLRISYNLKNETYDLIGVNKSIYINKDGTTKETEKSIMYQYGEDMFNTYFINYKNGVETNNSIYFDYDNGIALYNKNDRTRYSLVFYTANGHASLEITEEEYQKLHNLFDVYFKDGNLENFLNDNSDIFKEYALNIKEENQGFYENVITMLETSKTLKLKQIL